MTPTAPQLAATRIDGHVAVDHVLSARSALTSLPEVTRSLLRYPPQPLWDVETGRLPRRLQAFRRRARDFAQGTLAPVALDVDVLPHLPAGEIHPQAMEILRAAGRQGWLTEFLPWPLGSCAWLDYRYPLALRTCLMVEEFSRACGGLMLLICAHMLGMAPVLLSGQPRLAWRALAPAARSNLRGEPQLFAFAITEPGSGSDAEEGHGASRGRPSVRATPARGGWRLNGEKVYISGGDLARHVTVFAALEGEGFESWTCFLVPCDAPGFERVRTELKMGMRASGAAQLRFNDVYVGDHAVVGGLRQGWALNRSTLNISRMPVGAMGVGLAQAAVDVAIDHACRSRLGGRPLIDFQDVQMALAQMLAETSAVRALVWQGARTWRPRQGVASIAKFHCTDTAMGVIQHAMDLVGEQAVLHRTRLEKIYRDARLTQIFEGTNQINRLAVVEDLQEDLLMRTGANR